MAVRVPGWLVFLVFTPLQIWFFFELKADWGWAWTIGFFLLLGVLGNRAARVAWLTMLLFPRRAVRHEMRRHVFQGLLFLGAALSWIAPRAVAGGAALPAWLASLPQPWVPLAFLATLLKAALR